MFFVDCLLLFWPKRIKFWLHYYEWGQEIVSKKVAQCEADKGSFHHSPQTALRVKLSRVKCRVSISFFFYFSDKNFIRLDFKWCRYRHAEMRSGTMKIFT